MVRPAFFAFRHLQCVVRQSSFRSFLLFITSALLNAAVNWWNRFIAIADLESIWSCYRSWIIVATRLTWPSVMSTTIWSCCRSWINIWSARYLVSRPQLSSSVDNQFSCACCCNSVAVWCCALLTIGLQSSLVNFRMEPFHFNFLAALSVSQFCRVLYICSEHPSGVLSLLL